MQMESFTQPESCSAVMPAFWSSVLIYLWVAQLSDGATTDKELKTSIPPFPPE